VLALRTAIIGVELRELTADDAPTHYALVQANREHLLQLNDDHMGEVNASPEEFATRFADPENQSVMLGVWQDAELTHGNDKSVAVLQRCGFQPVVEFDTYTRYSRRLR
jgi:hypothetical protein